MTPSMWMPSERWFWYGPGVSVGWHSKHDERGVYLLEFFVGDAQLLHRLGGVVFHQHVAYRHHPVEYLLALGPEQVNGHAELVAGVGVEQRVAIPRTRAALAVGHTAYERRQVLDYELRRARR